jgi:hypothetical protein
LRRASFEPWPLFLLPLAVGIAVLYFFDPATTAAYPRCPFRLLTGWLCPGCGSLRGLHQLLHGNVGAAFRLNPLMVSMLPVLGAVCLADALRALRGRERIMARIPPVCIWLFVAVTCLFWIGRNLAP